MRAIIRRSLSPFSRRRSAKDLIDDIKEKEKVYLTQQLIAKEEEDEENENPRGRCIGVPRGPIMRRVKAPLSTSHQRDDGNNDGNRNKEEEDTTLVTHDYDDESPTREVITDRLITTSSGIPILSVRRSIKKLLLSCKPPSMDGDDSLFHMDLEDDDEVKRYQSRAGGPKKRSTASIPLIRQSSLGHDSIKDVQSALKQMEKQLKSAKRDGKRISRTKVMNALLSVVDSLEELDNSRGVITESGFDSRDGSSDNDSTIATNTATHTTKSGASSSYPGHFEEWDTLGNTADGSNNEDTMDDDDGTSDDTIDGTVEDTLDGATTCYNTVDGTTAAGTVDDTVDTTVDYTVDNTLDTVYDAGDYTIDDTIEEGTEYTGETGDGSGLTGRGESNDSNDKGMFDTSDFFPSPKEMLALAYPNCSGGRNLDFFQFPISERDMKQAFRDLLWMKSEDSVTSQTVESKSVSSSQRELDKLRETTLQWDEDDDDKTAPSIEPQLCRRQPPSRSRSWWRRMARQHDSCSAPPPPAIPTPFKRVPEYNPPPTRIIVCESIDSHWSSDRHQRDLDRTRPSVSRKSSESSTGAIMEPTTTTASSDRYAVVPDNVRRGRSQVRRGYTNSTSQNDMSKWKDVLY